MEVYHLCWRTKSLNQSYFTHKPKPHRKLILFQVLEPQTEQLYKQDNVQQAGHYPKINPALCCWITQSVFILW